MDAACSLRLVFFEMKYNRVRRHFSEYSCIRDGLSLRDPSQTLALTLGGNASFGGQSQIVIEPGAACVPKRRRAHGPLRDRNERISLPFFDHSADAWSI
jgi:hypothetical protein